MENLIKKLQDEAGLTEEQAVKSIVAIKKFMDNEGIAIDWGKFFDTKVDQYSEKVKSLFNQLVNKADDLVDKAKKGAKDLGNSANNFFG